MASRSGVIAGSIQLHDIAADVTEFDMLVDRVRNSPGIALADPLDVVALAGRPVYVDPLVYAMLTDAGSWSTRPLLDKIWTNQGPVRDLAGELSRKTTDYIKNREKY